MEPNRLFLPSARATNILLIVGFGALGYALYVRYMGIEQSHVGWPAMRPRHLDVRAAPRLRRAVRPFADRRRGRGAGGDHLLRPTLVIFALALAAAQMGVVLYNGMLASLAIGLLLLQLCASRTRTRLIAKQQAPRTSTATASSQPSRSARSRPPTPPEPAP